MKKKKIITVAIDSPAASGAGTQSKLIAKHYNLAYLDTGKVYRYIGLLRLKFRNRFDYSLIKKKIKKLINRYKSLSNFTEIKFNKRNKGLFNNIVSNVTKILKKNKAARDALTEALCIDITNK